MYRFSLAFALLLALAAPSWADERGLPLVVEHYDDLIILVEYEPDQSPAYENCTTRRVVFARGNRLVASRYLSEDMLWHFCHEPYLEWSDHDCHRIVRYERLGVVIRPRGQEESMTWFDWRVPMTDLQAPPAEAGR